MINPFDATPLDRLEQTILLGLKSGPRCLISAWRMEEGLRGMGAAERERWREGFCRGEGLSAEEVARGFLFSRVGPGADG